MTPFPAADLLSDGDQVPLAVLAGLLFPAEPLLQLGQLLQPLPALQLQLVQLAAQLGRLAARLQPTPFQVPQLRPQVLALLSRRLAGRLQRWQRATKRAVVDKYKPICSSILNTKPEQCIFLMERFNGSKFRRH